MRSTLSSTISKLRELLVAVVLDLVAQAARLVLGRVDDLAGAVLGGLHDLGALHHALGLRAGRVEDVVALAPRLGEELLALLEQPARGAQLVGQAVDRLLEELEHLVAVDHRRRRQRHRLAPTR